MTMVVTWCSDTIRQKSKIVFGKGSCVIINVSTLSYAENRKNIFIVDNIKSNDDPSRLKSFIFLNTCLQQCSDIYHHITKKICIPWR